VKSITTVVLAFAVLLAGCSASVPLKPLTPAQQDSLLDGSALGLGGTEPLKLPDDDVLGLSEEMKHFAKQTVAGYHTDANRLQALVDALISPDGLGITYSTDASYTARQVFASRQANCLSFTTLVIALARYLGLEARFNEVEVPPVWGMQNSNTLVQYRHVNAIFRLRGDLTQVVDINLADYDTSFRQQRIPDRLAVAQYYNNRSMGFLEQKRYEDALRYLAKSLTLEPGVSYLWSNLGSLYRRAGRLDAAELAYRNALDKDPRDLLAMSNAARLYRALGDVKRAEALESKVKYYRQRNPYYQYREALTAFLAKDYSRARDYVTTAIRIYPREHRFYFLLGAIYQLTGKDDLARQNIDKAIDLATDEKQISRYRHKFDMLLSDPPAG
jgi:Flp pilus assembly protein TadD